MSFSLFKKQALTAEQTPAAGDGLVYISTHQLIQLRHAAQSLPLKSAKVRALQTGQYYSPFRGRGMEFDEVRLYQPGDDVRTLDWRVTARTGKAHTKLFREERERSVYVWVDFRNPMFFATRGVFKSVLAAKVAALLAWSAHHQRDRVGGLLFSEHQHFELKPRGGKSGVLSRLRRVTKPGSLIFLISDFRGFDQQAESVVTQISKHNDVVMMFLHDPMEKQLPGEGIYRIGDGREVLPIDTSNAAARAEYSESFLEKEQALESVCKRHSLSFISLSTQDDSLDSLRRHLYLAK